MAPDPVSLINVRRFNFTMSSFFKGCLRYTVLLRDAPFKGECAAVPLDPQKGEMEVISSFRNQSRRNMDELSYYFRYVKKDITT
jgi:hypothetical protein